MSIEVDEIEPSQIAEWFRRRAAQYLERAAEVEREFRLNGHAKRETVRVTHANPNPDATEREVLLVTACLREHGSQRVAEIASKTGIPADAVRKVINAPDSIFEVGTRGWVALSRAAAEAGQG